MKNTTKKATAKKTPVEKPIAPAAAEEGAPAAEPKKAPKAHTKAATVPAKAKTAKATASKNAPKGAKAASKGEAKVRRAFSKSAIITELISRQGGATLAELLEATSWQKHSVRGFLSTLGKKIDIVSSKTEAGERNYAVKA